MIRIRADELTEEQVLWKFGKIKKLSRKINTMENLVVVELYNGKIQKFNNDEIVEAYEIRNPRGDPR